MKIVLLSIYIIMCSFLLMGCNIPGYQTKPERLTLGFPIWFGGPSMTWSFEKRNIINKQ